MYQYYKINNQECFHVLCAHAHCRYTVAVSTSQYNYGFLISYST